MSSAATDVEKVTIFEYSNGKLIAKEVCEGLGVIGMDGDNDLGLKQTEQGTEAIATALNVKRTSVRSMRSRIKGRER